MSLILEALRKSEAERRLGSAPDVLSAMPVMRVSAPRPRWPLPLAIGLLLALLAALAMLWRTRPAASHVASATTTPAAAPTAVNASPVQATVPPASAHAQAAPTISRLAEPHAAPTPRRIDSQPSDAPATPRPNVPALFPPPPIVAPTIAPPLSPSASSTAPPASAVAGNDNAAPAAEPALLPLAELSAAERGALPPLKVTMHVYAADPARRFMIVDGARVGEGARLADGVVLVRIRRDGAEIDVRGRRFLLPKP